VARRHLQLVYSSDGRVHAGSRAGHSGVPGFVSLPVYVNRGGTAYSGGSLIGSYVPTARSTPTSPIAAAVLAVERSKHWASTSTPRTAYSIGAKSLVTALPPPRSTSSRKRPTSYQALYACRSADRRNAALSAAGYDPEIGRLISESWEHREHAVYSRAGEAAGPQLADGFVLRAV